MFENYSSSTRLAAFIVLVLLTTLVAQAQSPTRLIYTQQSGTPASDQLKTADLTGTLPTSNIATLASDGANFGQPNDVVFDPVNNFIYVVDNTLGTGPILRYSYNSTANSVSNRTVIVSGIASATYQGLALDVANNRLYFSQSSATNSLDALKVVSGVSGNSFTVAQLADGQTANGNFANPRSLAFDPINKFLYAIDQTINTGPILRFTVNTTTNTVSNRVEVVAGVGAGTTSAYGGLALDQSNDRLYFTQYRSAQPSVKNSEDALKVVSGVSGNTFTVTELINGSSASVDFLFPQDLALDRENNYLYLVDQVGSGGAIYRYTTTGTGQTTIVGASASSSSYGGLTLNGGFFAPVTLTSSTPVDGATGVAATTNIVLTLNRAVNKGTGNFEIRRTSDNAVIETIAVNSAQVTGSGTTWTIDPSASLPSGTTYALRAANGIFTAADGGSYAGISDNTTLNFTTNAIPTDIGLTTNSVAENASLSTVVGTLSSTDADAGQTFSYSLVSGIGADDNTSFKIVGSQLQTNAVFNFETKSSYSIRVQTSDNGVPALSFQKSFTVTVTNVNEPPVINPQVFTIAENSPVNTVAGTIAASDPDAGTTLSYSITAGNISGAFSLTGNSLRVANSTALDFETTPVFLLTIQVSDGTLTSSASVTVNLTNVSESLTITSLTSLTVCSGAPVSLSATPTGFTPTNYAWSSSPAGFSGSGASLTQFTVNSPSVTFNTTYTIIVTATNGPSSVTAGTNVVVAVFPTATLTNNGPLSSALASVTLTAGGGNTYAFSAGASQVGGGNTATATNAGLYSVTVTGTGGCQATATTTVTALPDLTGFLYTRPSTLYGTSDLGVVVDVLELNSTPTSGTVVVYVSKTQPISLSLNSALTSLNGRPVQNSAWIFDGTSNSSFYVLTTYQAIAAGGILSFGLTGALTTSATSGVGTISSVIDGTSIGELRVNNNSNGSTFNYFNK